MYNEIINRNPNAIVILEHLSDNMEERELANYGMLLWGNMNQNYNEATMGYNSQKKSDLSGGLYSERKWKVPHLWLPMIIRLGRAFTDGVIDTVVPRHYK